MDTSSSCLDLKPSNTNTDRGEKFWPEVMICPQGITLAHKFIWLRAASALPTIFLFSVIHVKIDTIY
jgi:hypothetical protein